MANFESEFFGLVFPGFQATQKIHAQNSRPELSVFLSNFTFLNPKFIHGDFLLTVEIKVWALQSDITGWVCTLENARPATAMLRERVLTLGKWDRPRRGSSSF